MEAWGQSCDAVSGDSYLCDSSDYDVYSDGKAFGAAWDDGGNSFTTNLMKYYVACFKTADFCEGIVFTSNGNRYLRSSS